MLKLWKNVVVNNLIVRKMMMRMRMKMRKLMIVGIMMKMFLRMLEIFLFGRVFFNEINFESI